MDKVWQVLSAIFIASFSSWFTVQLSKSRFRSERWWERKVQAYERVIEAFHNTKKFDTEYLKEEEGSKSVTKERDKQLRDAASAARDEILRASDIGRFLLSDEALQILARYEAESESIPQQGSWYEYLCKSWEIEHRYMKEFIAEAKRDLRK